jgi:hypothetical protein
MSFFSVGAEFGTGLGGKHAADVEALGTDPSAVPPPARGKLVDAVRAAVSVMNKGGSSADIMGAEIMSTLDPALCDTLKDTDKVLAATCRVALQRQNQLDSARLVRLGLLTDEWLRLKESLMLASLAMNLTAQEAVAFNKRARAMAEDVYQATSGTGAQALGSARKIPWKQIFWGVGIFTVGIIGWKLWKAYRAEPQSSPND